MKLTDKTTNGKTAWEKYVEKNKSLSTMVFKFSTDHEPILIGRDRKTEIDVDGTEDISIISSVKTPIGGRQYAACRVGRNVGYIPIEIIEKPSTANPTRIERAAMNHLDSKLKSYGSPIDVIVLDKHRQKVEFLCENVVGCKNHPKDDKADFVLVDSLGNEVLFISHKSAGGGRAIQQYSGISEKSGIRIWNHRMVQEFLAKLSAFLDVYPLKEALWSPIDLSLPDGKELGNLAVFGENFDKKYSYNGVHMIASGSPIFRRPSVFATGTMTLKGYKNDENAIVLDWQGTCVCNNNVEELIGEYTPVLFARPGSGRGYTYNGKRYDGVRVMIAPLGIVQNRVSREI